MTRAQFDARYAATQDNTEGFTAQELAEINDEVFAAVADLDVDADDVQQIVKSASDQAFNAR